MGNGAGGGMLRARDIMTAMPQTVARGDSAGVLLTLLADGNVQAAPVVEGDLLAGIVTRSDLVALLARESLHHAPLAG